MDYRGDPYYQDEEDIWQVRKDVLVSGLPWILFGIVALFVAPPFLTSLFSGFIGGVIGAMGVLLYYAEREFAGRD